ncbi:hypothetical protein, partial [Victivallis vadensis]|uniref:hypothetical protein n=1 Tax=Victivallis vadensis TaxID=172901 RepID=UPI00266B609A
GAALRAESDSRRNPGAALFTNHPVPLKLQCPIPFQYYSINRSQKQYRTPEISKKNCPAHQPGKYGKEAVRNLHRSVHSTAVNGKI